MVSAYLENPPLTTRERRWFSALEAAELQLSMYAELNRKSGIQDDDLVSALVRVRTAISEGESARGC